MYGENVDRISELPEFILHNILSNLDTKEAGRSSVLSKTWYQAWSSVPVLEFRLQDYKKEYWVCSMKFGFDVNDEVIQSFLGFIDRTIQRYDTQNYRIRKLHLELPTLDEKIELLADEWIRVVVQNQVEELYIQTICLLPDRPGYRLPEILFRAKSLKVLNCRNVVLPYYGTMELVSLEYLTLVLETVDADLIQRILSFCPLVEFITTSDLGKISLPWPTNGNEGSDFIDTEITQSKFKASPLRKFVYDGSDTVVTWQLNMNVVALKNLRELIIYRTTITDDIVSELLYGLVALESLVLVSCSILKCIMISSISLKQLRILECFDLIKITIDAPNLIEFCYNCEVETSVSLINVSDDCNAELSPWVNTMESSITTDWLVKVKKILEETNFFQSLEIVLPGYLKIEVEEDQLRNVDTSPPYKLRELKLNETYAWYCVESPLMALDGLFCICHPDVLSITTSLQDLTAETILDMLNCEVQCWKHPLKSIEVEGIDSSRLLSDPSQIEFRFRLSWH
ncbi:F-box protein At3g59000-like isoform X2 [Silene latifolia]|uniref:F-box protein At3g59000-like isoform X2 n=1 Tax=Silene latifolia TaxID=37657 RepID=UPI003D77808E